MRPQPPTRPFVADSITSRLRALRGCAGIFELFVGSLVLMATGPAALLYQAVAPPTSELSVRTLVRLLWTTLAAVVLNGISLLLFARRNWRGQEYRFWLAVLPRILGLMALGLLMALPSVILPWYFWLLVLPGMLSGGMWLGCCEVALLRRQLGAPATRAPRPTAAAPGERGCLPLACIVSSVVLGLAQLLPVGVVSALVFTTPLSTLRGSPFGAIVLLVGYGSMLFGLMGMVLAVLAGLLRRPRSRPAVVGLVLNALACTGGLVNILYAFPPW